MDVLLTTYTPALIAMLVLLTCSAFFSCSEAALFSLSQAQKRSLADKGKLGERTLHLLEHSERLLNTILLGNLFVNIMFFTISAIITFRLNEHSGFAWMVGAGSLFIVIILGEIVPKNLGVTAPQFFALLSSVPLSFLVRVLQPILPVLSLLNVLLRRVLCPNFVPEPYLRVGDLERAVALSGNDAALLKREQRSLQNIVSLSDMEAVELMRPRSWIKTFRPPITFEQVLSELNGTLPRSGYCLLTEADSDEIIAALNLTQLSATDLEKRWDEHFEDVFYVPWSTSVAEVFDRLQQSKRHTAVVVNEFGETIGIITIEDIIAVIFMRDQSRSRGLLDRREMKLLSDNRWQLTGLTSLRTLERKFFVSFRKYSSLTVGGLLREILERFPHKGDICRVGGLQFQVANAEDEDDLIVYLSQEPE